MIGGVSTAMGIPGNGPTTWYRPVEPVRPPEGVTPSTTAKAVARSAPVPGTSGGVEAGRGSVRVTPAARILAAMPPDEAASLRDAWLGRSGERFGQVPVGTAAARHAEDAGLSMVYGRPRSEWVRQGDLQRLAEQFPALAKATPSAGNAAVSGAPGLSGADAARTTEAASSTEKPEKTAAGDGTVDREANPNETENDRAAETRKGLQPEATGPDGQPLSNEDLRLLEQLKARDEEVRTHEQAHVAAGGSYVRGGASYDYQRGPDGKRYAVGGEVSIDASPERDPAQTVEKMKMVRAAALAPAEPSAQDRRVAAQAAQREMEARNELNRQTAERDGKTAPVARTAGAAEAADQKETDPVAADGAAGLAGLAG